MASQVKGFWLRLHVRQEILIQFFILIYTFVVIILFLFSLSKYAIMAIGSLHFCDYFIIFSVLFLLSITHTLSFSLMFLLSLFFHSFFIPLPNHFWALDEENKNYHVVFFLVHYWHFLKFTSDTSNIYKCLFLQVKTGTPVESWPLLLLRRKEASA